MAYKCELVCDICGEAGITFLNITVSKRKMAQIAKEKGWIHTTTWGWVCPYCMSKYVNFQKYEIKRNIKAKRSKNERPRVD